MLFIGINPGGARYYPPVESVEEGNAYRIERWGERGTLNRLQVQVRRLYEVLSKKLGNESGVSLMDHTLAANFCPFRSRSWETLPRKAKSITFSRGLWDYLFDDVSPSVVVCLPNAPFKHFEEVLSGKGYRKTEALQQPVGWGNVTYSQVRFRLDEEELLMVKLPHLSRDTESSVGPGAVINRTSPV